MKTVRIPSADLTLIVVLAAVVFVLLALASR